VTATREALVLPCLFLTVALAGGFRPGQPVLLAPPSLFALVLSLLFGAVLLQSGALDPMRLTNPWRSGLENANGVVLVGALLVAAAQVFSLLTPDFGLPRVLFSIYFLVLMVHTLAVGPDRSRLLRSLGVTFGSAFVLKFVVLDALSGPTSSRVARAVQMLFDGITFGAVTQELHHPAAGYVAFATVLLFLVLVGMLPARLRTVDRPLDPEAANRRIGPEAPPPALP
jgi:hypothetical protein